MPRTYMGTVREPVKVDHTRAVLKDAAGQNNILWKDVAAALGMTNPGSLSNKLKRGSDTFTKGDLRKIAELVKCPMSELSKAIAEDFGA